MKPTDVPRTHPIARPPSDAAVPTGHELMGPANAPEPRAAGRVTVLHVMTVSLSLRFLRGQISLMRSRGLDLHVAASPGEELDRIGVAEGAHVHAIEMRRSIDPLHDFGAVARLVALIRRLRPDIVHAHTPKGGLLGMVAATLCRAPVRIYHMRGLPYTTTSGTRRRLLRLTEVVASSLAHRVIAVSETLRQQAIRDGIVAADKIRIMAGGSGNGVDTEGTYDPERVSAERRRALRTETGASDASVVVGFVGRIVRDKGIVELFDAWQILRKRFPSARLVLVGPADEGDRPPKHVVDGFHADPRVHLTGVVKEASEFYSTFDLLVLPTYREGFPNVLLEAGSMRVPVVATRVPGCIDCVEEGETGYLVEARDVDGLVVAMSRYLGDASLRAAHGRAARERVRRLFRRDAVWDAIYAEYLALLSARGTDAARGMVRV